MVQVSDTTGAEESKNVHQKKILKSIKLNPAFIFEAPFQVILLICQVFAGFLPAKQIPV